MSDIHRGEKACAVWGSFANEYWPGMPEPEGIAPDVEFVLNGMMIGTGLDTYRKMGDEMRRRHPTWELQLFQEFGDFDAGCAVWHGSAGVDPVSGQEVSLHGVTVLDMDEDGVITRVHFYYETATDDATYAKMLALRLV